MKTPMLSALVLLLYLAHQDTWNWNRAEPLFLGFLPVGLTYHAAFILATSALMALLVKRAWPADLDAPEADQRRPDADRSSA